MKILIIKTSSLGDIIHAFPVLDFLHKHVPNVSIDWLVDRDLLEIVKANPLVCTALPIYTKNLQKMLFDRKAREEIRSQIQDLKKQSYDVVFDLQGNIKSAIWTTFARSSKKVGLSFLSVREWPNILATNLRFSISKKENIRLQYLSIVQQYFKLPLEQEVSKTLFSIRPLERKWVKDLTTSFQGVKKIMVCPGAKWINKRLPLETLCQFLQMIAQEEMEVQFFLIWGTIQEEQDCQQIQKRLPGNSFLVDRMSIAVWQNLMHEMDLLIAVDSAALHLCGTTNTPSFSIFGPSSAEVFKPIGHQHIVYQGICPYQKTFQKTCPLLRTCKTGACIQSIQATDLFTLYQKTCRSLNLS